MAVTIKDIASLAGVSRGTVDRALHGRGRVDSATQERILALAAQMGYKPSRAAKQLAVQKQRLKFGIICRTDVMGFWSDVLAGVDAISHELQEYEVTVVRRYFNDFLPEQQVALIDELVAEGIAGLVIVPMNHALVRDKLHEVMAAGITVVIINSEVEGVQPFCYIGNDYTRAGRTAAGILHLCAGGRHINLAILHGTKYMMSHVQRIGGFKAELKDLHTRHTFMGGFEITIDPDYSYSRTVELLRQHPETDAIFTVAGSVPAVCKAIQDAGRANQILHVSYDLTPTTRPCLLDGTLTAAIGQEAFRQGYLSLKILFDYLVCGEPPEQTLILTHNEIFIRQNISPPAKQAH